MQSLPTIWPLPVSEDQRECGENGIRGRGQANTDEHDRDFRDSAIMAKTGCGKLSATGNRVKVRILPLSPNDLPDAPY